MQANQMMTLKDWIITIILLFIPIVSFIMLIIWALDKDDARNTFSKAYLIVTVGIFVLTFVLYFVFLLFIFGATLFLGTSI